MAEPETPKSLADPEVFAARRALLDRPHLRLLLELAKRIACERGAAVPAPDPLDGGIDARLLLLLETPGPAIGRTGIVSRDNPTGTAANLFRFLREAGIPRSDTLIWNAVPWVIHQPAAKNRAPRRQEVATALPYLGPLLDLLPNLTAIVLAGRVAGGMVTPLRALRPGLPVFAIPHPSPTYVCTSPKVAERIRSGLAEAVACLASAHAPQECAI